MDYVLLAEYAARSAEVQVAWLPALIGLGATLIGGIINKNSAEKQQQAQFTYNEKHREGDRKWFLADRKNERVYSSNQTAKDRAYAEKMMRNERDYARRTLVDERQYDQRLLQQDRNYMKTKLSEQRVYDQKMYDMDLRQYKKDRNFMQNRSNKIAESSAASRGIDFKRLRDDAVAAGYNPMTALSMAHAYSTHVDYALQGGVYSPRANYTTSNQGYSPTAGGSGMTGGGGGGSGAAPGAVMGSHVPAGGGFQASGGGYQSQFNPALSAGGFIQDAIERTADLWSNQKVERDPLADALRNAFEQDQMAEQVRSAQVPQGFGYDLTEQEPFTPAASAGVPALASGKAALTSARMPTGELEVGGRKYVPVTKPDGKPGRLESSVAARLGIGAFDTVSPGDWAEIVGEIGEVETGFNNPAIRRNITDEWHMGVPIGESIRDYFKAGQTGRAIMRKSPYRHPGFN